MAREKVKQVQVFSLPTEYERQAAEARRREMMAEMLAQQAYDPGQYQGAPIPKAAPVVKALEGYLLGREMRKAREAGEKAEAEVSRSGQQIIGRLMGGAPIAEPVMPDASGLDEVRVQSQYRASPEDAMRMAMTPAGSAAMRGNPALAAMLSRMMEKPEAEEFYAPTETADGLVQFGKRGGVRKTKIEAPKEALKPVVLSKEVDLGNVVELHYSDGSVKVRTKGLAPSAASAKVSEPTEGERKDAYNLQRIVNAAQTIKGATSTDPKAVSPGFMEAAVGMLPFTEGVKYRAQSPQRQVVDTAQTDLVDAFLTLATGAAYTAEQLQGQREALLPRYGESKESIAAKKQRVRALAEAAKVRAGRAWTPQMQGAIESVFGPLGEDEQVIKLPSRR
jgi:hypothetical protein